MAEFISSKGSKAPLKSSGTDFKQLGIRFSLLEKYWETKFFGICFKDKYGSNFLREIQNKAKQSVPNSCFDKVGSG